MNKCEKFRNLICEYVDGELSESDRELLNEHIKICHECKTELEMMKKTRECLTNMPLLSVPDGFMAEFRKNLTKDEETEKKVVPFYKKWRTYTSVAAVILFVFVLQSGLTDKNILVTETQPPKQDIQPHTELSMGADKSEQAQKDDILIKNEKTADTPQVKRSAPVLPQPQENTVTAENTEEEISAITEDAVQPVYEKNLNDGIAVASEEPVTPMVRMSGGGGGGSSSAVYESVYRATDNTATVFVKEGDFSLASALFDIMLYTPAEIESILTRNGINDFSIKTPIGDFEDFYVKVEVK